jgi:hypothetical protein
MAGYSGAGHEHKHAERESEVYDEEKINRG